MTLLVLAWGEPGVAQQMAARQFTVADGLADNAVFALTQDSRGYLWAGTRDGLSRFDGYTFKTYRREDGLPSSRILDLVEDSGGRLFVATDKGGLSRFLDEPGSSGGAPRFLTEPIGDSPSTTAGRLLTDAAGNIWALTWNGVFRSHADLTGNRAFQRVTDQNSDGAAPRAFRDREGRLWLSLDRDLLVFSREGREVGRYGAKDGIGRHWIVALAQDRNGTMYVANESELFALAPANDGTPGRWRRLPLELGPGVRYVRCLAFDQLDRLWIGTTRGLFWWREGRQTEIHPGPGATGHVEVVFPDRDGAVWLATLNRGLFRVPSESLLSYTTREGLPEADVRYLVEGPDARIYAATLRSGFVELADGRVVSIAHSTLDGVEDGRLERDARGYWWLGTVGRADPFVPSRLFVLPPGSPDFARARLVWSAPRDGGWTGPHVSRLPDGSVVVGGPGRRLYRASVSSGEAQLTAIPGFERLSSNIRRVVSDRGGNLWLATVDSLSRLRQGAIEIVPLRGNKDSNPRWPVIDSRGWLWVGFRDGVAFTRAPDDPVPRFEVVSTAQGLSSNSVLAIAEDDRGRMYFGTTQGLDRLDPASSEVRRYGIANGLAGAPVNAVLADSRGRVWAATSGGVSVLFTVASEPARAPPPTVLTRLSVSGTDLDVPERGTIRLAAVEIPYARNNLVLEYSSVAPGKEQPPNYQYRLEGHDRDWSAPQPERSVHYASLAPGRYRFRVRAVEAGNGLTSEPAGIDFTIEAPLWRRPWFFALLAALAVGGGAAIQRVRLRQTLALERLRSQMAMDLHDDVGAGLSQIAVLSELGRVDAAAASQLFSEVGTVARSLRGSMGEIVWAVDPRYDRLSDVVQRMRQVALHLVEAQGIRLDFQAPQAFELEHFKLGPDRRRHLYLIVKEAVHNAARHSGATRVRIVLDVDHDTLSLIIEDNGHGFDAALASQGQGIESLRRRAVQLGGRLDLRSTPEAGTRIAVTCSLG